MVPQKFPGSGVLRSEQKKSMKGPHVSNMVPNIRYFSFFPGGEDRLFFFRGLAFPYDPCMVYKYIYLHLVNFYDKCT